jgi:hypothetical protein
MPPRESGRHGHSGRLSAAATIWLSITEPSSGGDPTQAASRRARCGSVNDPSSGKSLQVDLKPNEALLRLPSRVGHANP